MTEFLEESTLVAPRENRIARAFHFLSQLKVPEASGVRGVIEMSVGGALFSAGTAASFGFEHFDAPTTASKVAGGVIVAGIALGIFGASEVTAVKAPNEQTQVGLEQPDLI